MKMNIYEMKICWKKKEKDDTECSRKVGSGRKITVGIKTLVNAK